MFVKLRHEHLLGVAGIAWILVAILDVAHALDEIFLGYAEGVAELECVDAVFCLVHDHHDIEGRLIIDKEFAVAVVDGATGGVFYLLEKSVGVGTLAIVVAHYLEDKEAHDVCEHYSSCYTTYNILALCEVFIHSLL